MSKRILVIGATGKQGGAVINELVLNNATKSSDILGVTRNRTSSGARLLKQKGITVVEGDPALDAKALFREAGPVDCVFLVTVPKPAPGKNEEDQAYQFIDAAVESDVKHLVFTSVDRGGPASGNNPTPVPHFASKHRIEGYLIRKAAASTQQMRWTILRPTAFYENLSADYRGKGFASMWRQNGDKKLQLVACRDIGRYAADAFAHLDRYEGKAISLAGDELSYHGAADIFRSVTGRRMPVSPGMVGTMLKKAMPELGIMFGWMASDGFKVDIKGIKKEDQRMLSFESWLVQESQFSRC